MRYVLGLFSIYVALAKGTNIGDLCSYITYLLPAFSEGTAMPFAIVLCLLELTLGILWVLGRVGYAKNLQIGVSTLFFSVHLLRIIEGLDAPCSCLGKWLGLSPIAGMTLAVTHVERTRKGACA